MSETINQAVTETVSTYPYLFFGYTVIWLLLAAYLWSLGSRLKKLERTEQRNKDASN